MAFGIEPRSDRKPRAHAPSSTAFDIERGDKPPITMTVKEWQARMKGCAVLVQLLDRKNETPVHGRAGQGRINADPRPTSFSCYRPSGAYSEGSEPSPTTGAAPADALGRSQLPANVPPRSELSSREAAEQFLRLRPRPRLNFLPLRRPPPAGSEWLDLKERCRLVLFLQERPLPLPLKSGLDEP